MNELPKEIGAPATRALQSNNVTTLEQVSTMTDQQLLKLHGVGPKAVKILRESIKNNRISSNK